MISASAVIGDDVVFGASAVVTKVVPDGGTPL